jgi:chromosome segregation ATPase
MDSVLPRIGWLPLIAVLMAVLSPLGASAQSATDTRLRDQLRQTTLQLRQAEDDNATLKAQLQSLQQQQAASASKPVAQKAPSDERVRQLQAQLSEKTEKLAASQQQLEQAQKALAQWKEGYDKAAVAFRSRDAEAKSFEAQYHEASMHAQTCDRNNAQLVDLGNELLLRYKHKTVGETLDQNEPLTQLGRIKLEKLAQEYHIRVTDLTVPPLKPHLEEGAAQ